MSNQYPVAILHQGTTYTITVAEDRTILDAAQAEGIDLPFSCSAGVCTTCAAKLSEGAVEQGEGMGLSPELQQEGYALLCVSYPRSPIRLESEKEDEVYHRQFQQPSA
jgi:ferredoxin